MANNMEQFERLYRRYIDRTVAYLMSMGFSREDSRDLAQDTFFRVYQGMEHYRGEAEWSYIQTTARRLALNRFRDNSAKKRDVSLMLQSEEELASVADNKPSPEEQAVVNESLERTLAAVRELPEKRRDCVLWVLAGHKYSEIAQGLGISEVTVKSRLHEARDELKLKGIELPWSRNQNGTPSTNG